MPSYRFGPNADGTFPPSVQSAQDARLASVKTNPGLRSDTTVSQLGFPYGAVSRISTANNSSQSTTGTSEVPIQLNGKCTNIRFLLTNFASVGVVDTKPSTALSLGVGLNIGTQAAPNVIQLAVNGSTAITVPVGSFVWTDPIAVDIDPAVITPRARIYTSGASWYPNAQTNTTTGQGGWISSTDLSNSNTVITETSGSLLMAPAAVYAQPLGSLITSIIGVGDSIMYGQGDGALGSGINTNDARTNGGGFLVRGARNIAGVLNLGVPGDGALSFLTYSNSKYRRLFMTNAANAICNYGYNDLNTGQSAAQLQANLITIWNMLSNRGLRTWQTTINPNTTSTDGWMTTTNQTIVTTGTKEPIRVAMNQWLRAGAPINNGAAVAVGTSGALIAGSIGHPLYGIIDTVSVLESAQDSGIFKAADNLRSVSDGGMNVGSALINSATANFTAADLGRTITVAGAGASGALYVGAINTVNSPTQVRVGVNASTTVSNAVLNIADTYTPDGTHPKGYAHGLMGNLISSLSLAY